mgnify:CR=1 FL=1
MPSHSQTCETPTYLHTAKLARPPPDIVAITFPVVLCLAYLIFIFYPVTIIAYFKVTSAGVPLTAFVNVQSSSFHAVIVRL